MGSATSVGDETHAVYSNHFAEKPQGIKIPRIFQKVGTFVIMNSRMDQDRFNTGYDIAAAPDFASFSCFGPDIKHANRTKQIWAYSFCVLLIMLITWKETNFIINVFTEQRDIIYTNLMKEHCIENVKFDRTSHSRALYLFFKVAKSL